MIGMHHAPEAARGEVYNKMDNVRSWNNLLPVVHRQDHLAFVATGDRFEQPGHELCTESRVPGL